MSKYFIMNNNIYVTRPSLPPLNELMPYLEEIWDSRILTNTGKFHMEFESKLCDYLGVNYISLFNNGTTALMAALKAANIEGEVITTPFTFAATAHSLAWNNLTPVFIDIDEETCSLDASKIDEAITSSTSAILGVHCYGNACDVDRLDRIAKQNDLKVIYDAAHAFGVRKYGGESLLSFGDFSVLSFHSTKVFNTFEGGAVVCNTLEDKKRLDLIKNFGHDGPEIISDVGFNGKMSEFNSALGLVQLDHISQFISHRKEVYDTYMRHISEIKGIKSALSNSDFCKNYSYFPVIFEDAYGYSRDEVLQYLLDRGIVARKYFYPLLSDLDVYKGGIGGKDLSVSRYISERVLCLPIYPDLEIEKVEIICLLLKELAEK